MASGSRVHLLRVLEVTGRIVRDVLCNRRSGDRSGLDQELTHVADLRRESFRRVVAQQMVVVPEQGAAARAVDDDEIGAVGERRHVPRPQSPGAGAVAGVFVGRAAASLTLRLHHAIAVRLERPPRRVVHVGEENIHDAAPKQHHGSSLGACVRRATGDGRRQKRVSWPPPC
jgi:hypothetical protein